MKPRNREKFGSRTVDPSVDPAAEGSGLDQAVGGLEAAGADGKVQGRPSPSPLLGVHVGVVPAEELQEATVSPHGRQMDALFPVVVATVHHALGLVIRHDGLIQTGQFLCAWPNSGFSLGQSFSPHHSAETPVLISTVLQIDF